MIPGPVDPTRHTFRSPQLTRVVQEAMQFLAATPVHALPPETFSGAGVYLLYYSGPFEHYARIASLNQQSSRQPIYIGKADPPGSRKGRSVGTAKNNALHERLRDHARSIANVPSLEVQDFQCQFMILNDPETDLISTVEAALIHTYDPLWNVVVDGFGNHDPGSRRYTQSPSEWDVLHPGRPWVKYLTGPRPRHEEIVAKIQKHQDQGSLDFS